MWINMIFIYTMSKKYINLDTLYALEDEAIIILKFYFIL